MFSDLILRNSRRSRKENGLFFGSLIISIVAFYIILSLSHQDVMLFLREMESDARQPASAHCPGVLCHDPGHPVLPDLFCL